LTLEFIVSHAALLLLRIDSVGNLIVSRQKLFLFRSLKKHFALNQVVEHL